MRFSFSKINSLPLAAFVCATVLMLTSQATPVQAQNSSLGIAAIVNDEVISEYDLEQRVRLVVGSSGLKPGPEELIRLREQVLRNLVDEKLKMQEAERLKVEIEQQEIVNHLRSIAEGNGVTVEEIQRQLRDGGVSIFTLTDQIKADMAWNMMVQGRFRSQVKINQDEIQRVIQEARTNLDQPQYNVVEIFLPVDAPDMDARVKRQANDLIKEIQNRTDPLELARQFSQSASAANGGDIGWVTSGQLSDELDTWLKTTRRGSLTRDPIRTVGGYYILIVKNTRNVATGPSSQETPLYLRRILVPLSTDASADKARRIWDQLEAAAKKVDGCNSLEGIAATIPGARVIDVGTKRLVDLELRDQQRVVSLVSGTAAGPIDRTNEGIDILVLCGHAEEQSIGVPTPSEVESRLFEQQLNMLSRRYLRDLRRDAVIDTRIPTTE